MGKAEPHRLLRTGRQAMMHGSPEETQARLEALAGEVERLRAREEYLGNEAVLACVFALQAADWIEEMLPYGILTQGEHEECMAFVERLRARLGVDDE